MLARRSIAALLIVCLAAAPLAAQQDGRSEDQSSDYQQGWVDGQKEAKGQGIWILSGLLLGPIGLILPWIISPTVPGASLIGKSSAYIQGYTAGYQKKAKSQNFLYSLLGFGITAAAVAVTIGVYAASAASETSSSCSNAFENVCIDPFIPEIDCSPSCSPNVGWSRR